MVSADRQTDRQTDRRHGKNEFFGISMPQNMDFHQNIEKVKNLFRKTAQYFLDTLHIREAIITP